MQVDEPELELMVTAYNINAGHNRDLMDKCSPLKEYAVFIERVRQVMEQKKTDAEKAVALEDVIDGCIRDGIMKDFLIRNREAVIKVNLVEYNEQDEREGILSDGIEQGLQQKVISLICRKLQAGHTVERIAEDLFEEPSFVEKVKNIAEAVDPKYDTDAVYVELVAH